MKSFKAFTLVFLVFLVSGCAIGNKYDYQNAELSLPVGGSGELGLAVVDNRSYVRNGDKAPNFIGSQRGGFGNPFDVTTASGRSLISDMEDALKSSLTNSG